MRQLASFLLIAMTLPVAAADIWRWKDANGVVHYSDQPTAGAERINPGPSSGPTSDTAATAIPQTPVPAAAATDQVRYTRCTVVTPRNDDVFNAVNTVGVLLEVAPGLSPDHRVQVLVDGSLRADWPGRAMASQLNGLYRGTHTLSVQVVDAAGLTRCAGPAISFHVRQPSLLAPGRQGAGKP